MVPWSGGKGSKKRFFQRFMLVWEGRSASGNRNLRGLPNMPRLPSLGRVLLMESASRLRQSPACRIFQKPASTAAILPRNSVNLSVHPAPGFALDAVNQPPVPPGRRPHGFWHGTCIVLETLKKSSQSPPGSVNSGDRSAKSVPGLRGRLMPRCGGRQVCSWRRRGWNHGAARNGYRKRTRVRVACGVTIRPRGVGTFSSHGHFGRSVDGSFLPFVVLLPVREELLRRGHLSRGAGLPAATLTASTVGFVRMSALADSMSWATRLRRAVVTRATSAPAKPAGLSGGWTRRTRPDPRTRLQQV